MTLHISFKYTWLVSVSCYYAHSGEQIVHLNPDKVDKATISNEIQIGSTLRQKKERKKVYSLLTCCLLSNTGEPLESSLQ